MANDVKTTLSADIEKLISNLKEVQGGYGKIDNSIKQADKSLEEMNKDLRDQKVAIKEIEDEEKRLAALQKKGGKDYSNSLKRVRSDLEVAKKEQAKFTDQIKKTTAEQKKAAKQSDIGGRAFKKLGGVIAGAFAIIGILGKFLTLDGALAGFYSGVLIMGIGGWTLGVALLTFFLVGSLATKLNKKSLKDVSFEKSSSQRDSLQALAKAGFASFVAFLTLVYPENFIIPIIVIAALGSSLADTMGTEIGILSKSTPRSVLKPWKTLKKGESGAVSAIGTLASAVTAFLYTCFLFGLSFIDPSLHEVFPLSFLLIIPIGSVIGMFLDSIFGVILQEQRFCQVCQSKVETKIHCDKETEKYSGFSFINNIYKP